MALQTRVYEKRNTLSFGHLLRASFRDVKASRFLSKQLAVRDIKAQYRQSYFGIFWAFITPLATALVWIVLNKTGTIKLSDTGVPYPVYAFSGALLWSIIIEAINNPMASTNAARGILSKINFPKEALVISGIYKLLFNSGIKTVLLFVFMLSYGVSIGWYSLLFPFAMLGAILFGTTIGLFITPLGMLYKDIGKLLSFGLRFVMYVTPVVYSVPDKGVLKTIMELNPFTPLILVARNLITGETIVYLQFYFWVIAISLPLLCIGVVFYRLSIPIIVERLSA